MDPVTSCEWSYNSTYRGEITPYPFVRPFIGVITPCITSRGPSCKESLYSWLIIIPIRTTLPETNIFEPENGWLEDQNVCCWFQGG